MAEKKYYAKINVKVGGSPIMVEVSANDTAQAKKLIECRPEFKSFVSQPQLKR
jgi:hypothetical protein